MSPKPKVATKKSPRARGEGGIFQRKSDGMWVGSIEAGYDENGKRLQKRVYAKDYHTLVGKLDEAKTEKAEGLTLNRTMTVAKWLDYWLPHVHKERIRPTTYLDYTFTVRNICKTSIGRKKLIDVQPADVRHMHTSIGKGTRKAQKAHVVLHRALKDAIAEGLIKRNVVDAVDQPDVRKGERKAFTVEQVQAVVGVAAKRNQMEYARWLMAFLTGTRQGECLGLTWDRVNFDDAAIDITWQLQQLRKAHGCGGTCGRKHGSRCTEPIWDMPIKFEYRPLVDSLVLTRPKSESGKRWVPMIEPLKDALKELAEIDQGPNPHNLVFHRADGYPIPPTDDNKAWAALMRDAEIVGMTLHSARHTTATVLRAAGADEQTRMEILGHNSPEVTRIYAHADQAKNSTMMDALSVMMPTKELG